ncbi:DUF551 domain-containing protein [Klebsiella aerogenes]
MTKSTITREQLRALAVKKIESLKFAITQSAYTGIRCRLEEELQLAEFALAAMDSEPVAYMTYKGYLLHADDPKLAEYSEPTPLYRHAHPAPVALKDHQMRELVNQLRDTAIQYHGTQQLREQIARVIRAAMLQAELVCTCPSGDGSLRWPCPVHPGNSLVIPDTWIPVSERMPETDGNYWGWWSESKRQGPVWFIKSDLQAQFQSSEITHWMPLPAAPQEVNGE